MDWFQQLTGFAEGGYDDTRARLEIIDRELRSHVNGCSYAVGELDLVSLQVLRERVASSSGMSGKLSFKNISGDVRRLHQAAEYAGALFQVASQFNLLEMVSPDVSPEQGVTRYQYDRTQGPACALAAGAATIYRNYFVPVGSERGQTRERQLDGLKDIGKALSRALFQPMSALWEMRNGYALCSSAALAAIGAYLHDLGDAETNALRALLAIGVQRDVQVTECNRPQRQVVSQAFCSALPVAYSSIPSEKWQPFARLVLEAAYEATLRAAILNARRGASNIVLLTRLGGGAFGNDDEWIDAAIRCALIKARDFALDVRLVSLGAPPPLMVALESEFR